MKTTPYTKIPAKRQWKKDSWVNDIRVKRDPVLKRIDDLLGRVPSAQDGGEEKYLECELYFATNYWLNNYLATTQMRREREPAVRMLRQFIETDLSRTLKCTPQMLRPRLQKHFVKTINAHGVFVDRGGDVDLSLARRHKYRISFECGKAYWLQWWDRQGPATTLELVNTSKANEHTQGNKKDFRDKNWGYFVMSFDREMYIGAHFKCSYNGKYASYHSSYLAGMPVQFAGSIKIIDGVVLGVRNNSGHYKPGDNFFINILSHLKTVGVDLKKVELRDFEDGVIQNTKGKDYRADRYLKDNGRWEMVLERKQQYLLDQAELRTAMGRKKIYQRVYPANNHMEQKNANVLDVKTTNNLQKLAEEQYKMAISKGEAQGFTLWRKTWKGICDAIWQFFPPDPRGGDYKYRTAWQRRALKPGPPPKPSKGPR